MKNFITYSHLRPFLIRMCPSKIKQPVYAFVALPTCNFKIFMF